MTTPKQFREAAEGYARRGMFVIPAHRIVVLEDGTKVCSSGRDLPPGKKAKAPAVGWKQFQGQPPTTQQVNQWWGGRFSGYNIACIHGAASGTVLIDTDGMEGYASLRALERELGPLPETPTVLSGGGGSHMLFRHPGRHVPTAKGLRECIDIRGDGGISIMPPSIHEFGQYEWECDLSLDDLDFADLPPAWVQFITTPVSGNGPAGINAGDIQWQPADDGSILVTDGRETYMRNVIWKELHAMMQQTGQIPSAADLATRAAAEYMPHVDHGRPGRGLDELIRKCEAAVAKAKRQPDLIVPPKRGLTRPFLIR